MIIVSVRCFVLILALLGVLANPLLSRESKAASGPVTHVSWTVYADDAGSAMCFVVGGKTFKLDVSPGNAVNKPIMAALLASLHTGHPVTVEEGPDSGNNTCKFIDYTVPTYTALSFDFHGQ